MDRRGPENARNPSMDRRDDHRGPDLRNQGRSANGPERSQDTRRNDNNSNGPARASDTRGLNSPSNSRSRASTSEKFAQDRRAEQAPNVTRSASGAAVGGPPRAGTRTRFQPRVAINHVELSPPVELRDDQSYGSSDGEVFDDVRPVSYTHLRAHET